MGGVWLWGVVAHGSSTVSCDSFPQMVPKLFLMQPTLLPCYVVANQGCVYMIAPGMAKRTIGPGSPGRQKQTAIQTCI